MEAAGDEVEEQEEAEALFTASTTCAIPTGTSGLSPSKFPSSGSFSDDGDLDGEEGFAIWIALLRTSSAYRISPDSALTFRTSRVSAGARMIFAICFASVGLSFSSALVPDSSPFTSAANLERIMACISGAV
jgi:hypothetical protein